MKDIIFKLLKSTNEDDILIVISMIAELENPRAFFRKYGYKLEGAADNNRYKELGPRYAIHIKSELSKTIYYKIRDNLYILFRTGGKCIVECYSNYSDTIKVINHEH